MATAWRIVKRRHVATAFDGEGARRFGGRWNSPGRLAVYTSSSVALALLELLVHLDVAHALPALSVFRVDFADELLEIVTASDLPSGWRAARGVTATRRVGDAWLGAARTPVLAVPSAIVPQELNYVLNPAHPGFARLAVGSAAPFRLDRRLA